MNLTLPKETEIGKKQIIIYISIILICIISIVIAFYVQFYARIDIASLVGLKEKKEFERDMKLQEFQALGGLNSDESKELSKYFKKLDVRSYLLMEEVIFFGTKSIFMAIVCLFHFSIYWVLLICIIGVLASGFFLQEKKYL